MVTAAPIKKQEGGIARHAAALRDAVDKLGGQNATARLLGVAQPSVWRWLRTGQPLPAKHVLTIERETGISRHDLNPEVYPRETAISAASTMEPAR